ncbi:hypothetical protein C8R44DRAFT_740692 [Mycena epipterygia]|nr:hypothetical protein C8R44DRAFT_740692 [Mycena epipterygia]
MMKKHRKQYHRSSGIEVFLSPGTVGPVNAKFGVAMWNYWSPPSTMLTRDRSDAHSETKDHRLWAVRDPLATYMQTRPEEGVGVQRNASKILEWTSRIQSDGVGNTSCEWRWRTSKLLETAEEHQVQIRDGISAKPREDISVLAGGGWRWQARANQRASVAVPPVIAGHVRACFSWTRNV